jgi:anti-sigma-K factor RskA
VPDSAVTQRLEKAISKIQSDVAVLLERGTERLRDFDNLTARVNGHSERLRSLEQRDAHFDRGMADLAALKNAVDALLAWRWKVTGIALAVAATTGLGSGIVAAIVQYLLTR